MHTNPMGLPCIDGCVIQALHSSTDHSYFQFTRPAHQSRCRQCTLKQSGCMPSADQWGSPNVNREIEILACACQTPKSSLLPHPTIGLQSSHTQTIRNRLSCRFQIHSGALMVLSQALGCSTSSHRLNSPIVTTSTRRTRVTITNTMRTPTSRCPASVLFVRLVSQLCWKFPTNSTHFWKNQDHSSRTHSHHLSGTTTKRRLH
jgi:hypothetical protein